MARARHPEDYAISLFPMFNILICTLGILIFILGALATLALGPGRSVMLQIGGESVSKVTGTADEHPKTPRYLDWDGSSLVIVPGNETVSFDRPLDEIETFEATYAYIDETLSGSGFPEFFREISESSGREYVVLFVRPSGFDTLYEMRGYIESRGIELGYEPLMQDWGIRVVEE